MEMRQIASDQGDRCNHVSIDVENPLELVTSVREKLGRLSPLSFDSCIYRAPKQLRQAAEKSFIPKVISIGPLHHNTEDLQDMEEHKLRYLKEFLQRTKVRLEDCIKLIKKSEARLRNCYAEAIELSSDSFVEMILVDATFIVELLLRISFPELRIGNDYILGRPRMLICIAQDMLLLENQLPFFIMEDLLSQAKVIFPPENDVRITMIKLSANLLKCVLPCHMECHAEKLPCHMEYSAEKLHSSRIEHFLDFVRSFHLPPQLPSRRKLLKTLSIPNVTQLYQAGVKFKVRRDGHYFGIRFDRGILEIPPLQFFGATGDILRNLIAYERCHFNDAYISNCAFLIDRLIDTHKDVEILIQNQILETNLPDSQGVATLVNNLAPGGTIVDETFYFADLAEDLNAYCRVPWHKWKATLKRDYFGTPWAIISVTAAIVLLFLTFIQTVFTINSNRCS